MAISGKVAAIFLLVFSFFRHVWPMTRRAAPEITIALVAVAMAKPAALKTRPAFPLSNPSAAASFVVIEPVASTTRYFVS